MSLLTNEQIAELTLVHDKWWDGNVNFQEYLIEWNERQTATQFEPDWDNAPSNAKSVFLHAVWFDNEMNQVERTVISGWGRPVTPHPHAAMIMKYAEVAQRRSDPWMEFEWLDRADDKWKPLINNSCMFYQLNQYRHIGETE